MTIKIKIRPDYDLGFHDIMAMAKHIAWVSPKLPDLQKLVLTTRAGVLDIVPIANPHDDAVKDSHAELLLNQLYAPLSRSDFAGNLAVITGTGDEAIQYEIEADDSGVDRLPPPTVRETSILYPPGHPALAPLPHKPRSYNFLESLIPAGLNAQPSVA